VYAREQLPIGGTFAGPAIVEQLDATTVIDPDCDARVDPLGNLIVRIRRES